MTYSKLIKTIITRLEKETIHLSPSEDEDLTKEDSSGITEVRNLCLRLRDAYCSAEQLNASEFTKLEQDTFAAKKAMRETPTDTEIRKKYFSLSSKLEQEKSICALDQILSISNELPDILNLLILTNFFNTLAHLSTTPKQTCSFCYDLKNTLIENLIELTKNKNDMGNIVIPSADQNATCIAYFWITEISSPKIFSWHAKDLPLTAPSDFKGWLPDKFSAKNWGKITQKRIYRYLGDMLGNTGNLNELLALSNRSLNKLSELSTPEFTGGGIYESQPEPTAAKRNENEMIKAINDSSSDTIKKLLSLTASVESRYTFDLNKIITAEIMQTAFTEGIITKDELEKMHLKIFDSVMRTSNCPDRAEIKSCGKGGEKKVLTLHLQKNPASKPLSWEISKDTAKILGEKYSGKDNKKITLTSGRDVKSEDNIPLLEKITEEQLNYTAQKLNDFIMGPDAEKKLQEAVKNADSETKALVAAVLYKFAPKQISKKQAKPKRNGGPTHG